MKCLFILVLLTQLALADDLAYKDRSNEGENKFERIGKLESYISNLSSKLLTKHTEMKKDFKKELKTLEDKLRKEMAASLEVKVKKIEKNIGEVSKKGSDFAQKKYAKETRGQLKTLRNRIVDLLAKVEVLELKMQDIDARP